MAESASRSGPSQAPLGIEPHHHKVPVIARWRTPLATVIFTVVLGGALAGWLGGGPPKVAEYRAPGIRATLEYQPVLRSGNWFETVLNITPAAPVKDLVVAVDQPLWRGLSIDTMAPDARSAQALDGRYSYHFGEVKAAETIRIKFDGQLQPRAWRTLSGNVTIQDADRRLIAMPMRVTVLP